MEIEAVVEAELAGARACDGGQCAAPLGTGVEPSVSAPAPSRHGIPASLLATAPHIPCATPYVPLGSAFAFFGLRAEAVRGNTTVDEDGSSRSVVYDATGRYWAAVPITQLPSDDEGEIERVDDACSADASAGAAGAISDTFGITLPSNAQPAGAGFARSGGARRSRSAAGPSGSGNADGGSASGGDALPEEGCGWHAPPAPRAPEPTPANSHPNCAPAARACPFSGRACAGTCPPGTSLPIGYRKDRKQLPAHLNGALRQRRWAGAGGRRAGGTRSGL
jgi:hypothetical protein